jgi:hypothetical protein
MHLDKRVAEEHFMLMIVEPGQARHLVKPTTTLHVYNSNFKQPIDV